jgi:GMP synthase (glutamine-hydrolysing)
VFGLQFHPEVELTVNGSQILNNFLYKIANCKGLYQMSNREENCLQYIKRFVGDGHVLCLVSGGVDSAACTALITKALGSDRVTTVHIDNGFMRKDESSQVAESLNQIGINPQVISAGLTFRDATTLMSYCDQNGHIYRQPTPRLNACINAEEKRHIIGDTFVKIATDILRSLDIKGRRVFLAQGTLRPDLIESASSIASAFASVIKTHHNDTALVREMRAKGLVVEPLVDFHKDEVRQLAKSLGLPPEIINRHPFPGPGLAIRVICQDEPYIREEFTHINLLLHAVVTYNEAVQQSNSYTTLIADCTSSNEQLFLLELTNALSLHATVLPIYTVGVQGDARSYNYVAALSSNERNIEWTQLFKLAKLIPKICHTINRVVWVFGKVVFGPINDVTPTHLTSGVLATLREADSIVNGILLSQRLMHTVSQMPVILIPIHFDRNFNERPYFPSCQRSIVLRPFLTSDFMTGTPAIPGKDIPLQAISEMVSKIMEVPGISRVLYDLTPKPPGTTEWE